MYIKEESSTSDKEFVTTETQVCGGSWEETATNRLLQENIMTSPTSVMQILPCRHSIITTDTAVVNIPNPETQTSGSPKKALDKSTLKCNNVQMCSNIILPPPSLVQSLTSIIPTTYLILTTSIIPTSNNGIVEKQPPEQMDVLSQVNNTNASCNEVVLPKTNVPNNVVEVLPLVTVSDSNING